MTLNLPDLGGNPETPQTPEKRNISVSVTDGANPVSGVNVSLTKNNETIASSTTGSAGGCTLSNVEDGSYTLIAIKEGYSEYTDTVTTSIDNASLTIQLTPTSSP